jgi:hypothetical protein
MDERYIDFRQVLPYRKGFLGITDTHLIAIRGDYRVEKLLFKHLSAVQAEQAHSFRHRVVGMVATVILLVFGVGVLGGPAFHLNVDDVRLALAGIFAIIFGLVILFGVATSRRIWWLSVKYGSTYKLMPLPGVDLEAIEPFLQVLREEIKNQA